METDAFLYKLHVMVPGDGIVYVETGDKSIGNEILYRVWEVVKGCPIEFRGRGDHKLSGDVNHVTVSGEVWDYEAF